MEMTGFGHKNLPTDDKCERTLWVIYSGITQHWFYCNSQWVSASNEHTTHYSVCSQWFNLKSIKLCLWRRNTEPCSGYVTQHRDDKTSLPLSLEAWPFRQTGWQAGSVESQWGPGKKRTRWQTLSLLYLSEVPFSKVTTRVSETVRGGGFFRRVRALRVSHAERLECCFRSEVKHGWWGIWQEVK